MVEAPDPAPPLFMGAEHVAQMNARLAGSEALRRAAAEIPREVLLAYRLDDADSGSDVWWQMRFSPQDGVAFALGPPAAAPDLTFVGSYWDMVAAVQAQRRSQVATPQLQVEGDVDVLRHIGAVFSVAQKVATVPVSFPGRRNDPGVPLGAAT